MLRQKKIEKGGKKLKPFETRIKLSSKFKSIYVMLIWRMIDLPYTSGKISILRDKKQTVGRYQGKNKKNQGGEDAFNQHK